MSEKTIAKKTLQERLEANWENDRYKDHIAFYIAPGDKEEKIFLNDESCNNHMAKVGLKGEPIPLTKADYKKKIAAFLTEEEDSGYPEDKPVEEWEMQHLANWLNEHDVEFNLKAKKSTLLKSVKEEMAKLETPS